MFQPYHGFTNCRRLETLIKQLGQSGNVPEGLSKRYKTYHFSLIYKLKCARYYLEKLEVKLSSSAEAAASPVDFMFEVNMSIDGFFYSCGSSMDILAREVLTYYDIPLPQRVYFETAREEIRNRDANDSLLPKLEDKPWRSEFQNYRNALIHELIIALNWSLDYRANGDEFESTIKIPLPDDPRVDPPLRTFERNPDALVYAKNQFKRLLKLISPVYSELIRRIRSNGRLPL